MDFERARFNMVEQQIRPWEVLDLRLLDVIASIPREYFVSEAQQAYAYADMHLPLANGSYMLEPKIIARLVQALNLKPSDHVLEIASGAGYATAILAKMAKHVTTVDIDADQQRHSAAHLARAGIENVTYKVGDGLIDATYEDMMFDAIYVGGGISQIPDFLKKRLTPNGRLVAVIGQNPVMHAVLVTHYHDTYDHTTLFDTNIPHLIQGERSLNSNVFMF